jgi:hypothetical protein
VQAKRADLLPLDVPGLTALAAADPVTLPWIAAALDRIEHILADLLG